MLIPETETIRRKHRENVDTGTGKDFLENTPKV
jgi:hypothetical protein